MPRTNEERMVPKEVLAGMGIVLNWAMAQLGPAHLMGTPVEAVRERYLMLLISAGDLLPALGAIHAEGQ